ncbi:CUB domain protein [Ancylostoma caninum]|uniref:CUB domain protein n=1 Tax=Ancylostoma caninum TaxID=29170 RepID=A0A368GJU0_ANCCA|nr:CUB domain protein [Ancylostoma caninum]
MERMRTLERVVETRIDLLEWESPAPKEDCAACRALDCDIIFALLFTMVIACLLVLIMVFWLKGVLQYEDTDYVAREHLWQFSLRSECDRVFDEKNPRGEFQFPLLPKEPTDNSIEKNVTLPRNLQCVYTFVAGPRQRVKLEFEHFHLAGSSESCEIEYVDIYSELERVESDLLSASLGGRYCGTVSPHVRISLHRVLVLVFHSRAREVDRQFGFRGRYSFIPDTKYQAGTPLNGEDGCDFLIEASKRKKGAIFSPTYPGTYPKNFHCSYLLKGRAGQRIRLFFRDFDIYFGGEHCPYDSVTIFDGPTTSSPIIKKVCGLQQRTELYSVGTEALIHFNTTNPAKADPRGFVVEYEFSSRFVDVAQLLHGQKGVTHMRGTECDVRVESNRETTHYIYSPKYPEMYPPNTTCTYILDGLQGDQNLEKVILTFEEFAVLSDDDSSVVVTDPLSLDDITCPAAWVGIAISDATMKATLSSTDESNFESTLCERIPSSSPLRGPYVSTGPRMVVQFGTTDKLITDGLHPSGFKAKVEFKTDFGVTGESIGTSNECLFRFRSPMGFFNSPRYPANYPLDTNCTYFIEGKPGQQILIHFEQFALYVGKDEDRCKDWLEIYDVFQDNGDERLVLQERYCSDTLPGPTVSAFGAHAMRVVFSSDSTGSGNGFKALYEIRPAAKEDIPSHETKEPRGEGAYRCGRRIRASETTPTGFVMSPNYPVKYNKDVHCDWEITARDGYKILLTMVKMEIEGEMTANKAHCQKAVIRVSGAPRPEYCGTNQNVFTPFVTKNNSVRISFLTSPDKVNGLKGFNMSWTEVREVKEMSECSSSSEYMCTYSKLCISSMLRCNGDANCGYQDDTDETHCARVQSSVYGSLSLLFSNAAMPQQSIITYWLVAVSSFLLTVCCANNGY